MYFSNEVEDFSYLVFEQYKSMFSGFKMKEDGDLYAKFMYIFLTIIQVLVMFNLLISIVGETRSKVFTN
jgi:hypothetical protein